MGQGGSSASSSGGLHSVTEQQEGFRGLGVSTSGAPPLPPSPKDSGCYSGSIGGKAVSSSSPSSPMHLFAEIQVRHAGGVQWHVVLAPSASYIWLNFEQQRRQKHSNSGT
jgi:hypothetical protein